MIPNRGAPRGRTLQGHGAPREHHGGDTGGQRSAPQILLVLALPPAAVPRAPVPHFQPKTQLLGHQAPPPGPAGGKDLAPQSQSASPPHATRVPHAALALPAVRFAGREGAKKFGGGHQDRSGGSSSQPRAPCHTRLCPAAEENGLTLQKCWSQVAPIVMSFSKIQPAARLSTPWAQRGGDNWSPRPVRGPGGSTARPRVPPSPPEKERAGRRGVFGCVVLVIINISFWHQHHLVT